MTEEQAKDEPEQARDDAVIRVGDAYQAHVPRLQPPMDDGPSAACEGELLHVGALFDGTAPTLSSSRGRRDVARAPTPGSKHRRAGLAGSSANGAEGAAATSRLDDVDGAGSAPPALPGFQGFAFPLPPMPRGEPSASQERALGWQLVKLGWSPKRQVPPELLDSPRREWSAAERKAFAKALSTQGKHFREMLPLLPGRSLDELVERYYATKAHKRMAQVDSEQATRNVRVGPCGAPPSRPPLHGSRLFPAPAPSPLLPPPPPAPSLHPPSRPALVSCSSAEPHHHTGRSQAPWAACCTTTTRGRISSARLRGLAYASRKSRARTND